MHQFLLGFSKTPVFAHNPNPDVHTQIKHPGPHKTPSWEPHQVRMSLLYQALLGYSEDHQWTGREPRSDTGWRWPLRVGVLGKDTLQLSLGAASEDTSAVVRARKGLETVIGRSVPAMPALGGAVV
jgi:hypothetical protein